MVGEGLRTGAGCPVPDAFGNNTIGLEARATGETMKHVRFGVVMMMAAAAFGAGLVTYGSTFTGFSQVVVGPPAPTTIATVPSLLGYGVVVTWEAVDHPDISGFRIERYGWDEAAGTWSHEETIVVDDPAARTRVDMCGMGRKAYRVQSFTGGG